MGAFGDIGDRAQRRWQRELARPKVAPMADVASAFARDAKEDRITGLAAEVAFYSILSLFPAVVALAALLGFVESLFGVAVAVDVEQTMVDAVNQVLGAGAGNIDDAIAGLFEQTSPGLLGLGLAATLYTVSRAFNALINALDVVYDIPETRNAVRTRLLGIVLAVGSVVVAAVVLTMFVVGPAFGSGRSLASEIGLDDEFTTWWYRLRTPLVILGLTAWASVMFHVAPNHRTPWRADVPGAVVTMVLWLLGAWGFGIYLRFAGEGSNAVFGVLGGALTLLLWLYVMGLALLVGGEVNAHLEQRRAGRSGVDVPPTLAP